MNENERRLRLMISQQETLIDDQKKMIKILQDMVQKKTDEITVSGNKYINYFSSPF